MPSSTPSSQSGNFKQWLAGRVRPVVRRQSQELLPSSDEGEPEGVFPEESLHNAEASDDDVPSEISVELDNSRAGLNSLLRSTKLVSAEEAATTSMPTDFSFLGSLLESARENRCCPDPQEDVNLKNVGLKRKRDGSVSFSISKEEGRLNNPEMSEECTGPSSSTSRPGA